MKWLGAIAVALLLIAAVVTFGAEQTWTGEISDGLCRAEHMPLSEGDPILPAAECVRVCHRGGYKYVFATGDKVYEISNQNDPSLEKFAGQTVKISGQLKGDSIAISKIEMPVLSVSLLRSGRFPIF